MKTRFKVLTGLVSLVLMVGFWTQAPVFAKSANTSGGKALVQRYIIVLDDPPLASYDGRSLSTPEMDQETTTLQKTAGQFNVKGKLDVTSTAAREYLGFLDQRFETFRGESLLKLGREIKPLHRYRIATNGFAADLTAKEAATLSEMRGVKGVMFDEVLKLQTDSGPNWLGADILHNGDAGYPASGGEGIVVGVFDTGINWDHPSFIDPGEGIPPGNGVWDHENPYGTQLGLCSEPEVLCNDKLVGVWEMVEDNPNTDVVEETNQGKDNVGHGSLVASVVAGNPATVTLNDVTTTMGGVAPNANIISYRVCYLGDAADPDDDGCQTSAILRAIDQAIEDGVDVVNHSIGGGAHNPWYSTTSTFAFLNLLDAGTLVISSAGNDGPEPGTVGSPENAPWMTAVGAATHDRVFANALENLTGGDTTPPSTIISTGSIVVTDPHGGTTIRKIVHAKDYGSALCGSGEPESGETCDDNTGASNPFQQDTFNGEIVVCDRGEYGRREKGKNLMLAGAGGYILANADDPNLQSVLLDDLCLPSVHIGQDDANQLRTWLDSGAGHQGSISGFNIFHIESAGDVVARFSSRGPALPPVGDLMKPEMIAPGVDILGASDLGNNYNFFSGTSFAAPHVAGAAALVKSVHPDWTPAMINSALILTATPDHAVDYNDSEVNVHKVGAGRPRLDVAINAGLYLDENKDNFLKADPARRGSPKSLNLAGLVDSSCSVSCDFQRTVTDLVGGASWSATAEGLAEGVSVTITPNSFSLANGASQALTIVVNMPDDKMLGNWQYGRVRLSSAGHPDAVLPLAVYASGGELPEEWLIETDSISGWQDFELSDLVQMPDATFLSGGLSVPTTTSEFLKEDPSGDNIFDGTEGIMTVWHDVKADTMWLHAETLASTSEDLDLYVGRDIDGDGKAEANEILCTSESPTDIEFCDLFNPVPGDYWIIVQNWSAGNELDEATLKSVVIGKDTKSLLSVTGDGIVSTQETQKVRVSWDNVSAVPGTELVGAVGVGTSRENPNNIGIIPVRFIKTAVETPKTLVLMNGITRGLTMDGNDIHKRIVLDVPPGVSSFTLTTSAIGEQENMNASLGMELYRIEFDAAFSYAPFAVAPDTSGSPLASATGTSEAGPTITVDNPAPGRWYVVLNNSATVASDIEIRADMSFTGTPIPHRSGLWDPASRPGLSQGIDYSRSGDYRALLWYTYDEAGQPTWYQAADPSPAGNVWVATLYRFTNDGTLQHETAVGHVSVTTLAEEDSIFSFVLYGEEGSDRMAPNSPPVCPTVNGQKQSYNGIWSRPSVGVGGVTAVVNEVAQGYLQYLYDDKGRPIWLLGANLIEGLPHAEAPLLQFSGYCAVCTGPEPTTQEVGLFTIDYTDETSASWNLNYVLAPPLSGSVNRTDPGGKLTTTLTCQ